MSTFGYLVGICEDGTEIQLGNLQESSTEVLDDLASELGVIEVVKAEWIVVCDLLGERDSLVAEIDCPLAPTGVAS